MNWLASSKYSRAETGNPGRQPGHSLLEALLAALYRETGIRQEYCRPRLTHYAAFAAIRELPPEQQKRLVFLLTEKMAAFEQRRPEGRLAFWDGAGKKHFIHDLLLRLLLRSGLGFSAPEFRKLFDWCQVMQLLGQPIFLLPILLLVRQLEDRLSEVSLTPEWMELLTDLRSSRFAGIFPSHLRFDFLNRAGRQPKGSTDYYPEKPKGNGEAG